MQNKPPPGRKSRPSQNMNAHPNGKTSPLQARRAVPAGTIPAIPPRETAPIREVDITNKYYLALSNRYKIIKVMVIIALTAFCIGMVTIYRDDITVENFRYMLRDFDINSTKYTSEFNKINYAAGSDSSWALFKGDLVVTSPSSLYIYGMSGVTEMSENISMTKPIVTASDRYILVYDTSVTNNVYSLFNTFSILDTQHLDHQITGASVADNGYYAIATRTDDYKGAVFVYDSSFKLVNRILKDKHIMDVSMRRDGGEVLVLSAYDAGGDWCTEIMTIAPGAEAASTTITLQGSMPVKACYSAAGGFAVLCDNCVVFYNAEGFEVNRYNFSGEIPVTYGMSENFTMLAFNKNVLGNEKIIRFWDSSGTALGSATLDGRIICTASDTTHYYFQTPGALRIIRPGDNTFTKIPTESDPRSLLVYSDGKLVMCGTDGAIVYDIGETAETGSAG